MLQEKAGVPARSWTIDHVPWLVRVERDALPRGRDNSGIPRRAAQHLVLANGPRKWMSQSYPPRSLRNRGQHFPSGSATEGNCPMDPPTYKPTNDQECPAAPHSVRPARHGPTLDAGRLAQPAMQITRSQLRERRASVDRARGRRCSISRPIPSASRLLDP